MKKLSYLIIILLAAASCTSQKKLAYINNLPEPSGEESFRKEIPEYKLQTRDIIHVTAKAMGPDGKIQDYLSGDGNTAGGGQMQGDIGSFLYGYDVKPDGTILIPVLGKIKVEGNTIYEVRTILQTEIDKVFRNTTVECKLLSFKFTVIGEVNNPGIYNNYDNYLTIFEAIARAGGLGDFGKRDRVLVVRSTPEGSLTYRLNMHDKTILTSEAYYLLPNDVVIVEPQAQKIFNMNLPTIAFIISTFTSTVSMTLLLLNLTK